MIDSHQTSESFTVEQCIYEFTAYIQSVCGMSENTVCAYKQDLQQFAAMSVIGTQTPVCDITLEDLRSCIAILSKKKRAPSSINRFISSVRSLFAYCRKFQYIKINPALELKNIKQPKKLPRFMTADEVDKLCRQPDKKELIWRKRDKALFEVFYSTGCRLSEVAGLKESDFEYDYSSAIVNGKGNKDRRVYLGKDSVKAVKEYLEEKHARFGVNADLHLFVNLRGRALSTRDISRVIERYSGVEGTNHPVSPHAFRHTFATAMLTGGADIRLVQDLLGHASISTTQRYTHISAEYLIEMYNKAHPHGGDKK